MYGALQAERPGNECTECGKDRTGCKCTCVLCCGGEQGGRGGWEKSINGEWRKGRNQGTRTSLTVGEMEGYGLGMLDFSFTIIETHCIKYSFHQLDLREIGAEVLPKQLDKEV